MALTTTGRTNGGTAAEVNGAGTIGWNDVNNVLVYSVGGTITKAYSDETVKDNISEYIQVTNFGFAIPATATVKGVKAYISSNAGTFYAIENVYLVKGGTIETTSVGVAAGTSGGYAVRGGETSTWGVALEYSDVNASTFGVAVSMKDIYAGTIYGDGMVYDPPLVPSYVRYLAINHIQLEVYYLEAEADSTVSGRITSNKEYKLWIGTANVNGEQRDNVELVLDIQETVNSGVPVWGVDSGKEALTATNMMVSGEGRLDYWSPNSTVATYVETTLQNDNGADIEILWESADFPLGDEKDEFVLKDIYVKYNPSTLTENVECTLSARIDMGDWEEQQVFNFTSGSAGMAMIRTMVVSGTRGRTLGIRLEATTDQPLHIYEILVVYDKNVTDIKHAPNAT